MCGISGGQTSIRRCAVICLCGRRNCPLPHLPPCHCRAKPHKRGEPGSAESVGARAPIACQRRPASGQFGGTPTSVVLDAASRHAHGCRHTTAAGALNTIEKQPPRHQQGSRSTIGAEARSPNRLRSPTVFRVWPIRTQSLPNMVKSCHRRATFDGQHWPTSGKPRPILAKRVPRLTSLVELGQA